MTVHCRPRDDVAAEAKIRTFSLEQHRAGFAPVNGIKNLTELIGHLRSEAILRRIVQDDGRKALFYFTTKVRHDLSFQLMSLDVRETRQWLLHLPCRIATGKGRNVPRISASA